MPVQKFTFIKVLNNYLIYSEAFSVFNQLDDEDKKVIRPYIDGLRRKWQEELKSIRQHLDSPLSSRVKIQP